MIGGRFWYDRTGRKYTREQWHLRRHRADRTTGGANFDRRWQKRLIAFLVQNGGCDSLPLRRGVNAIPRMLSVLERN